jgi:outer membrane protein TolC
VPTEAQVIQDAPGQTVSRRLSLSAVLREAENANLDLAAADRAGAAGFQLVREARSGLLPRVDISGSGLFIDQDRAAASFAAYAQPNENLVLVGRGVTTAVLPAQFMA